jgi:hypothetical protein
MQQLPATPPPQSPFRDWRRFTPAASLCAAVLLGVTGWAHFFGGRFDETSSRGSQQASLTESGNSFPVSPIRHEVDDQGGGRIVTASASRLTDAAGDAQDNANVSPESGPQTSDERFRSAILGVWEDEYRGKRHLTVRDDGTGTMLVEPDGIGKRLLAAELKFELEWTVTDGRVTMTMIRGEPKSKVQLILKLYGQEAEYRILEMTDDRMQLMDPDGKTRYDWRRPGPAGNRDK